MIEYILELILTIFMILCFVYLYLRISKLGWDISDIWQNLAYGKDVKSIQDKLEELDKRTCNHDWEYVNCLEYYWSPPFPYTRKCKKCDCEEVLNEEEYYKYKKETYESQIEGLQKKVVACEKGMKDWRIL